MKHIYYETRSDVATTTRNIYINNNKKKKKKKQKKTTTKKKQQQQQKKKKQTTKILKSTYLEIQTPLSDFFFFLLLSLPSLPATFCCVMKAVPV